MSISTKVAPVAPVVVAPVAPVVASIAEAVAPVMSNGDAKPSPATATNSDAVMASWLKAQRMHFERRLTADVTATGQSVYVTFATIEEADKLQVWKNAGLRNVAVWVDEVVGDTLAEWPADARKLLSNLLKNRNVRQSTIAKLTGVSEATISRDVNASDAGAGATATPPKPSTATDRLVKQIESLVGAVNDVDKYATADLKRLGAELRRAVAAVTDELASRPQSGLKSGATGTVATGVAPTPKPSPGK